MLASVLQFSWPINAPEHISLTWTSVAISWPVIVCMLVSCWAVCWFKRKIRESKKDTN